MPAGSYDPLDIAPGVTVDVIEQAPDLGGPGYYVPLAGGSTANRASTQGSLVVRIDNSGARAEARRVLEEYLQQLAARERALREQIEARNADRESLRNDIPGSTPLRVLQLLGSEQTGAPDFDPTPFDLAVDQLLAERVELMVEVRATAKTQQTARKLVEVENWTTGADTKRPAANPDLDPLRKQVEEARARVRALEEVDEAAGEEFQDELEEFLGEGVATLKRGDAGALTLFAEKDGGGGDTAPADGEPADLTDEEAASLAAIRRGLNDVLPPGRIVIPNTGLERGDGIVVEVDLIRKTETTNEDGTPGPPEESVDEVARYAVDLDDFGWRTAVRGSLIFHRADTVGPESSDKPWRGNVAALYEWGYLDRFPEGLSHVWNALEPSFGFHVASVDLDPDTGFEVGAGANLSFFDGLLSFGYGYDLMAERFYYFLGGDLFKLIDTLK